MFNQNLTGLSFVGKSTLFSRVAASPQPVDKAMLLKQQKIQGKNESKNQGQSILASNNQSTTINQTLNNNSMANKSMRSSVSTFKDTVQRGVLSGIGILKK